MQDYNGKRVYVTGGSSGIGLAIAVKFARLGADVAVFGRDSDKLETAVAQIEAAFFLPAHQQAHGFIMDVSDENAVTSTLTSAMATFGVPDILILSAGGTVTKPFQDLKVSEFDKIIQTNLMGTVASIAAVLPRMSEDGGSIMLVSSMGGLIGAYGYSAYSSSKFALLGLGEVLRWELEENNISVSILCPPEVETPFVEYEKATIPLKTRAAKDLLGTLSPEYVADLAIKGLVKGKFLIIPGFRAKAMYMFSRLLPPSLMQPITKLTTSLLIKTKYRGQEDIVQPICNPDFSYVKNEVWIAAPPEQVWPVIIDHAAMGDWMPFKGRLLREGEEERNGKGAIRELSWLGIKIVEEVTESQSEKGYTYRLKGGAPIKEHRGDIILTEVNGGTRLRWNIEFKSNIPGTGGALAGFLKITFKRALLKLKSILEK